ncbi:MAG TPA: hypothetical protein ENI69_00445 [Rhodospirillales bacterium]|nr:hypothetical protein [Rhodospirillales bacterium]
MLKFLSGLLLLSTLFVNVADARHVLGRSAYSLNEDSNTPSTQQFEWLVGDFTVTYMIFPAFPQPGTSGRISLYVKNIESGDTFDGKVKFTVRDDVMVPMFQNAHPKSIGTQPLDDNMVYRQSFQFSHAGNYIVSAQFSDGGEDYNIDFPLRVGDVSPVSPVVIAGGLVLIALVIIALTQRRRAMTGKIRGEREIDK